MIERKGNFSEHLERRSRTHLSARLRQELLCGGSVPACVSEMNAAVSNEKISYTVSNERTPHVHAGPLGHTKCEVQPTALRKLWPYLPRKLPRKSIACSRELRAASDRARLTTPFMLSSTTMGGNEGVGVGVCRESFPRSL